MNYPENGVMNDGLKSTAWKSRLRWTSQSVGSNRAGQAERAKQRRPGRVNQAQKAKPNEPGSADQGEQLR